MVEMVEAAAVRGVDKVEWGLVVEERGRGGCSW